VDLQQYDIPDAKYIKTLNPLPLKESENKQSLTFTE